MAAIAGGGPRACRSMPGSARHPRRYRCRWNRRCAPTKRSGALPSQTARGGLADRALPGLGKIDAGPRAGAAAIHERRLRPILLDGDTLARRAQWRSRFSRAQDRSEKHPPPRRGRDAIWARNGHIAIVAAVLALPGRSRRGTAVIADTAFSRNPLSRPRPKSARAATPRVITPRRRARAR